MENVFNWVLQNTGVFIFFAVTYAGQGIVRQLVILNAKVEGLRTIASRIDRRHAQ